MKGFVKYLLTVFLVLGAIITYIAFDIHQNKKQARFACDFDGLDRKRIEKLAWKDIDLSDETNAFCNNPQARTFGEVLFFDKRLSASGEMSCATCHPPEQNWALHQPQLELDVPSLWNTAHNRWYFWDGRADSLWSQAAGPLENSAEQAGSRTQLTRLICQDKQYRRTYENLFGSLPDTSDKKRFPIPAKPSADDELANKNWQSMTIDDQQAVNLVFANLCKAIAAFEHGIIAPQSRFDVFAAGVKEKNQAKVDVMTASEQRGLKVFIGKGKCTLCHSGINFTDREFHLIHLPLAVRKTLADARLARVKKLNAEIFNSLGDFRDDRNGTRAELLTFLKHDPESVGHYKTPTLRNVAHTAPYMHDGSFKTLRQVIDFYSEMTNANNEQPHLERVLEPLHLTEIEKVDLEAFLRSLSSEDKSKKLSLK
ncbi:MAG: hypothetical protein HRT88_16650 [Lentisphaeraceae bacterium]|nr:hypothetical protein [Lentisphaeraceae bacterium]